MTEFWASLALVGPGLILLCILIIRLSLKNRPGSKYGTKY